MELDDLECAVVLDAELPIGAAANIAAIMGVSLGKKKAVNKLIGSLPLLR